MSFGTRQIVGQKPRLGVPEIEPVGEGGRIVAVEVDTATHLRARRGRVALRHGQRAPPQRRLGLRIQAFVAEIAPRLLEVAAHQRSHAAHRLDLCGRDQVRLFLLDQADEPEHVFHVAVGEQEAGEVEPRSVSFLGRGRRHGAMQRLAILVELVGAVAPPSREIEQHRRAQRAQAAPRRLARFGNEEPHRGW